MGNQSKRPWSKATNGRPRLLSRRRQKHGRRYTVVQGQNKEKGKKTVVSEEVKREEKVRVEFAEEVGQEFQEEEEESEKGESKVQKFFRKIRLNQNEIDQFLDNGYDSDKSI